MSRPIGALAENTIGLSVSATLAIQARSAELLASGRAIGRLGLGQSPFPVPRQVAAALAANAHQKDYLPVQGLPALRDTVAAFHRQRHGIAASAADVMVGPGSKELMFLLQLVHGGVLLLPTPAWVSYEPQARLVGRQTVRLETTFEDGWRLLPATLEAWAQAHPDTPAVLILNYPSNPTGGSYDAAALQGLAEVAQRHRLIVLSDEIYGELHFKGAHVSIARWYPEGTILASGLSKWCGAGGWRLGTFTFPAALRPVLLAMAAAASETFTSTSAPIQYAAIRAFEGGESIERYLSHARGILGALLGWSAEILRGAGARVTPAEGGFYLFPDFSPLRAPLAARGILDSITLAERLLEEANVATLPGTAMGRPASELTLRLALVDFDGGRALAAVEQGAVVDEGFLELHLTPTVRSIRAIARWLSEPPPGPL